jgi:hypothetical protein
MVHAWPIEDLSRLQFRRSVRLPRQGGKVDVHGQERIRFIPSIAQDLILAARRAEHESPPNAAMVFFTVKERFVHLDIWPADKVGEVELRYRRVPEIEEAQATPFDNARAWATRQGRKVAVQVRL